VKRAGLSAKVTSLIRAPALPSVLLEIQSSTDGKAGAWIGKAAEPFSEWTQPAQKKPLESADSRGSV
jgi:hypothetical protein